jgi:hypothetical protein
MHISRSILAFTALAIVLALSKTRALSASSILTLTEQEVFEALIAQDSETMASKKLVIKETTSVQMMLLSYKNYDEFAESLRHGAHDRDEAFKEALDDFLKKNRTATQIIFATNTLESIELVSNATLKEIFSAKHDATPNGWDLFHRRFPDAHSLITISRVGLDSKGTVAIIYLGSQRGYTSGRDRIRVLRRESGKWVLQEHERIGPYGVS